MRIKRIVPAPPLQDVFPSVDLSQMDALIARYKGKKGKLIPLLQGTQALFGYIPREAFLKLNRETGLSLSELYGVATFYAQFRLTPSGKHIIKMCHGTACHVQNVTAITDELLDFLEVKDGGTTADGLFTVETVACLGCCSLAPVMMVDEETHGKLTPKEAVKIIKEIRRNEIQ
ncbi:MAG: NADH-quinone oxidoreductase subunit NuoE [Bacteroidales bacterium]|nr:NADH-quinone oxidoreductase subunit NuoE [Bacteroidales bacterium]NLM93004.1 NADH-quinone oxidoreductase subunit NuoE [Bacteroidales bacterium]